MIVRRLPRSPIGIGPDQVAPLSTECRAASTLYWRTEVTHSSPAAGPAYTSAGCASADCPSLRIGRGVHVRAPRGSAQYMTGCPTPFAYSALKAMWAVPAASTATPGASPRPIL